VKSRIATHQMRAKKKFMAQQGTSRIRKSRITAHQMRAKKN